MPINVAEAPVQPLNPLLDWGATATSGPYTLAPGLTNYTILTPTGVAPTQADLTSHRYHHHTRVAFLGSRVWVMFSSSLNNEDAAGQMVVGMSSPDGGTTWTSPVVVLPSQSTMDDTTGNGAMRVAWPRHFITYGGNLYACVAIQSGSSSSGLALSATLCNADGSVGTPFQISVGTYTATGGAAQLSYDGVLGPPLFAAANLYGCWGGSTQTTIPYSAWVGWAANNGSVLTELATIDTNAAGVAPFLRLFRCTVGNTAKIHSCYVDAGGNFVAPIVPTTIPNSPSSPAGLRLLDGRIAVVGNPVDAGTNRDPLFLALFSGAKLSSVYAVRQGLSDVPTYAGGGKAGGASYPGICTDGPNLWISYSMQKEKVGVTKITLSGI